MDSEDGEARFFAGSTETEDMRARKSLREGLDAFGLETFSRKEKCKIE